MNALPPPGAEGRVLQPAAEAMMEGESLHHRLWRENAWYAPTGPPAGSDRRRRKRAAVPAPSLSSSPAQFQRDLENLFQSHPFRAKRLRRKIIKAAKRGQ